MNQTALPVVLRAFKVLKPAPAPCVLVDLDGTLFDTTHRQHHLEGKKKNWSAFFNAMVDDPLFEEIAFLVELINRCSDHAIILTTGRPSNYETHTRNTLARHRIPFDLLMMRRALDTTPDADVKRYMLDIVRSLGYYPTFAIDDRPEVVAMWRANGVPVLQPDASMWAKNDPVDVELLNEVRRLRDENERLREQLK